jgi:hypothetical protein
MSSGSDGPGRMETITRTANPARRVFHWIISLLGWTGFAWFLYNVFIRPIDKEAVPTFILLGLLSICIMLLNLSWIRFNLRLHRTMPRRTRARELEYKARTDVLGRPLLDAQWDKLRVASCIQIELTARDGAKRYSIVEPGTSGKDAGSWSG